MKANELMIGDWVQNPLGWKAQVQSIRYVNTIKDEWEWLVKIGINNETFQGNLSLNEIGAIPLTPEILEKNGFKDVSTHTLKGAETYQLSIGDYKLTYKLGDYFTVDSFDDKWWRLFETRFCYKWAVHQLQHALRLCGIEKEIVL